MTLTADAILTDKTLTSPTKREAAYRMANYFEHFWKANHTGCSLIEASKAIGISYNWCEDAIAYLEVRKYVERVVLHDNVVQRTGYRGGRSRRILYVWIADEQHNSN